VNTKSVPRRIRDAGHLDGIVQIGTGYLIPREIPVATFEDMTVRQVETHPYLGWDALSKRAWASRIALQRKAYDQAVAVCLTSRWAAESVVHDYGIAPEKVHIVGVGRNHSPGDVAERDWSVPHFLFVGIDWERKNGPAVLRAFARTREQIPQATLDIVGGHPPIEQEGVTAHGILRLDVPEQHERVERLFARATCFVMPSLAEASAIAYVEAGAAGVPSIGSSSGGSEYLIGDGGVIVDPHDDDGLLDAMRQLSDGPTAMAMGKAAKRRSERFTWPEVGRRLLEALDGTPAPPLSKA
jgi:glycosyltransferase involved in cell wall biosynthesis